MGSPGFKVFEPFNVTSSLIVGWIAPGFGQVSNSNLSLLYGVCPSAGWSVGRSVGLS